MASDVRSLAVNVASHDALDVRRFDVKQRISSLFEITLTAVSPNLNIDFEAILGQPATFEIDIHAPSRARARFWTGICNRIQQVAVEEAGLSTYELSIVPSLWFATQRRNHRIFQHLSELDIVQKLLGEWGITPTLRITGAYKKRDYRVQYGESDYAFARRMLEDAGISFYFEQGERETLLVLSDAPAAAEARSAGLPFKDHPTALDREYVTRVHVGQRVRPGRYTMRDHDARLPSTYKLSASAEAEAAGVEGRLERFHYTPGAFRFGSDQDEKEAVAKKRLEAKRASAKAVTFETTALDLSPGVVLNILDHPRADTAEAARLLVVESRMSGEWGGQWTHRCEATRGDVAFRPPLVTRKPKVAGVESATVVGPAGEEIHTDEFGRVRVHFHWDRESKMDAGSSTWIPVCHPWAGGGFGMINLPRIGQEVIVDFLGGDPDRPVITGRLYTASQRVPYSLPANKTQSGWKSNTSPGGGGHNEIMFEDAAGQELVRMQAQKDLHKLVKHDESVKIGRDRDKAVGNDDSLSVGHDRKKAIGHDEAIKVGHDRVTSVGHDEELVVGNDETTHVLHNAREVVGMNRSRTVGLHETVEIGERQTIGVGDAQKISVGGAQSVSVGGAQKVSVGKASTETVALAKALTIGAAYQITVGAAMNTVVGGMSTEEVGFVKKVSVGDKIEITCGKSKLVLESSGKVTIEGTEIDIKSEGPVNVEGKKITEKGGEIVITAEGPAEVHGAP